MLQLSSYCCSHLGFSLLCNHPAIRSVLHPEGQQQQEGRCASQLCVHSPCLYISTLPWVPFAVTVVTVWFVWGLHVRKSAYCLASRHVLFPCHCATSHPKDPASLQWSSDRWTACRVLLLSCFSAHREAFLQVDWTQMENSVHPAPWKSFQKDVSWSLTQRLASHIRHPGQGCDFYKRTPQNWHTAKVADSCVASCSLESGEGSRQNRNCTATKPMIEHSLTCTAILSPGDWDTATSWNSAAPAKGIRQRRQGQVHEAWELEVKKYMPKPSAPASNHGLLGARQSHTDSASCSVLETSPSPGSKETKHPLKSPFDIFLLSWYINLWL